MKPTFFKLLICLFLDFLGYLSFTIPIIGEFFDIIWAPIYALIIQMMFNKSVFSMIALGEELLPGTDIIPSATIFWFIERLSK